MITAASLLSCRLSTYSLRYAEKPMARALWDLAGRLWREGMGNDSYGSFLSKRSLSRQASSNFSIPALLNPSLKGYFEALTERDRWTTWMDDAIAPYDALLFPVPMTTEFGHCSSGTAIEIEDRKVPYSTASGAYLQTFNFTGHPAVVIPIGKTAAGAPMGLQIVGKRWQDLELLAVAKAIDAAIGKLEHPPDALSAAVLSEGLRESLG